MTPTGPLSPPPVRVTFGPSPEDLRTLTFEKSFHIGRGDDCEVCIKVEFVSRNHVQVLYENGQWWVRDQRSANGLFVNGQRLDTVPVGQALTFRLGIKGPFVQLEVERPKTQEVPALRPSQQIPVGSETQVISSYMERYFGKGSDDQPAGEHTMMVRRAFQKVQKKQRWRYGWVALVLILLLLGAGAYAYILRQQVRKQQALAKDLFYNMKIIDLSIANVEKEVMDSHSQQGLEQIRQNKNRRKDLQKNYDDFLTTLNVYDPKMSEQDRLILRMARVFGECELDMPPEFKDEVNNYIGQWKSTKKYPNDVKLAIEKGYAPTIEQEFLAQELPPQFFYLAMVESDFNAYAAGPQTYAGVAKGMWQFIPQTAVAYGLKIGPLADSRQPDPGDDRHHWDLATHAAARYIKDLYRTKAQASGLLVMASYNWGESKVIKIIEGMPENPKERNFWKLLAEHKAEIPKETYNYVFSIFAASVIGENPKLFGFDFDNPLGHPENK
jgi:membrane-bound lytic murein transglycosylase D